MTVCVYAQVYGHEFVAYDDDVFLTLNFTVQQGLTLAGLRYAFEVPGDFGTWHPLTVLSHMLDVTLFGLDHPGGHHLMSVAIHIASALLLFRFLFVVTRRRFPSIAVALLFALHPLQVESVAWAAERKEVLSGLFFFATLNLYAHYVERPGAGRYALVLAGFVLALMAKAMVVTLPALLLLLDFWPLRRMPFSPKAAATLGATIAQRPVSRLLLEKVPLLLPAGVAIYLGILAQGDTLARPEDLPVVARLLCVPVFYAWYLWKTLVPVHLASYYPHPFLGVPDPPGLGEFLPLAIASTAFLAAVTVLAFVYARKFPYLVVGWCWFGGMLLPVIGLLQIDAFGIADRCMYLPGTGLFVLIVWGGDALLARWPVPRGVAMAAGAAGLVVLAGLTYRQAGVWKNTETLFQHNVAVTPESAHAHAGLGLAYLKQGRNDDAAKQFRKALEINPHKADIYNNLGLALFAMGNQEEARAAYRQALVLEAGHTEARLNLGNVLALAGDFAAAAAEFKEYIRLNPENWPDHSAPSDDRAYAQAHSELGYMLLQQGRSAEALPYLEQATEIDPDFAPAHRNLGRALNDLARFDEAVQAYQAALKIDAEDIDSRYRLGMLLEKRGEIEQAKIQYQAILARMPENAKAAARLRAIESARP